MWLFMADHSIPKSGADYIKKVIEEAYETYSVGDLVDEEDISDGTELGEDNTRRQKKFLAEIGVLDKDGWDYSLTQKGHEVGRALSYGRDEDARGVLNSLLADWDVTKQLEADLEEGPHSLDDLTDSLAYLTESDKSSSRKRRGLKGLVHLYTWSGILSEESGEYVLSENKQAENGTESAGPSTPQKSKENEEGSKTSDPSTSTSGSIGDQQSESGTPVSVEREIPSDSNTSAEISVNIDLEVSSEDDPQQVAELISAIRSGISQESDLEKQENEASETNTDLNDFKS